MRARSTFFLIPLQQILGGKEKKKSQLWDCHRRALLGQGWVKRYACWSCIYQHKHPIRDYFRLHLQHPSHSHSDPRSHHLTLIYFHFSSSSSPFSSSAAVSIQIVPMLICLLILLTHSVRPSLKNPGKTHKRKHANVYEACHAICPLPPRKVQYILLYGVHKFPILYCVSELHSIYDAWQGLQFSISSAAHCE